MRSLRHASRATQHFVLLVPFGAPPPTATKSRATVSGGLTAAAYGLLALLCFLLHTRATAAAYSELLTTLPSGSPPPAFATFASALLASTWRNVCQLSISIDVVLASVAGAFFVVERSGRQGLLLCAAAPLISPAAALALHEALTEARRAQPPAKAD